MKTAAKNRFVSLLVALVTGVAVDAFGQGSLTPPAGTPAPTMRTLSQVEPRTPISELPYAITAPGSYYLVSNLTVGAGSDGISVQASNVTLDLGGFTLSGSGDDSGRGICQSADCNSLRVLNGTVTGFWGSGAGGVHLEGANNQVDGIRAIDNFNGIYCENMSRISGCTAYANQGDGITLRRGTMSGCAANGNQGNGIAGESFAATDCTASENSGFGFGLSGSASLKGCVAKANQGGGIRASADSAVSACVSEGNFANGVELLDGASATGCTVSNNRGNGIVAQSKARIAENVCRSNGLRADGAGIYVTGFGNRVEKNHVTDAVRGLHITGSGNIVAENTVLDNADNYVIASGNRLNLLLCEIPETLEWPCSVRLAGTLTCLAIGVNGITVNADDVTIDMAGHALVGPGADSGSGIYQASTNRNLHVTNGKAINWRGSASGGVFVRGAAAMLSDLQVSTNYFGISIEHGGVLSTCVAYHNSYCGILVSACTVNHCVASQNGQDGMQGIMNSAFLGCTADMNNGYGFSANDSVFSGCASKFNTRSGFEVSGSNLSGCVAENNGEHGIDVCEGCTVAMCTARNNGTISASGAGVHVWYTRNRIENNLATGNDIGFSVSSDQNFIARNSASGNTLNWSVVAGNVCLVVRAAATTGTISGDSGGVAPGSTDPNANFTH